MRPGESATTLGVWLASSLASISTGRLLTTAKAVIRYLAHHTGVPAVLVAALLLAIGYRVLKRGMRFAVEVAAVTFALVVAAHLGWIRW